MHQLNSHALIRFAALLVCLACMSASRAAVIDYSESVEKKVPPELRLKFTLPVQYINHSPQGAADEIAIQVRFLQAFESDFTEKQRLAGKYSKAIPILDISYEPGTNERGVVRLRFKRRVNTLVLESADKRALIVSILPDRNKETPPPAQATPKTTVNPDKQSHKDPVYRNRYVVNLESSTHEITTPEIVDPGDREEYVVYTTKNTVDGRQWTRLRAGFFATESAAVKFLSALKNKYPNAWITRASIEEIKFAQSQAKNIQKTPRSKLTRIKPVKPEPVVKPKPAVKPEPARPITSDKGVGDKMEQARQAVARGKNSRAIRLYTDVLASPGSSHQQDALEFLGVTLEKNGQITSAMSEYRRYLKLYPDGEDAERVKQRLAGLTTASKRIPAEKQKPMPKTESNPWDIFGGLSMFYRHDENTSKDVDDSVTQSSLYTDLDFSARRRTNTTDIQTRFTGSYLYDFLDSSAGDESSVSSLFVDAVSKTYGASMRLGRFSRSSGGVLGRVDGLLLGYKTMDWLTLNVIGGFPVISTRDQVNTDRYLYGISADLGTFANAWDFSTFLIEQRARDILDRRAIGGEARYFDTKRSLLTLVDYDISYQSLNSLIITGSWRLEDKTTFHASFNYRNNPILTTTNAIQGQSVSSVEELEEFFTENEIRQLAEDRTSKAKTYTVGFSRPLNKKLQLNGDITVSNISSTRGSDLNGDGVIDTTTFDLNGDGILESDIQSAPGTGNEVFYNLQLVGSSLIKSGDTAIVGIRYADTKVYNGAGFSLDTRYPINRDWRVNPRLRFDYRENSNDDSKQWLYRPEIRTDYRLRKHFRFEFELGGEWSIREISQGNDDSSSFFFSTGFRTDF